MTFKHVRSLVGAPPLSDGSQGSVTQLTKESFPLLDRLSIKRITLKPGALREPHWHANAHELTYCLAGSLLVMIVDSKDGVASFTLEPGQMFFARSGSLHAFENVGLTEAELIAGFTNEAPEDLSLRSTFGCMTDAVLGNTFGLPAAAFSTMVRTSGGACVVAGHATAVPRTARFADPHRFDLQSQTPVVDTPSGTARVARTQFWPALEGIAMYSIVIGGEGMREVHWHPETAEMGYVQRGRARMTVLDPDGSTETFFLSQGDAYFVPRAYPHQIEVLDDEIHFLIFFDRPTPGDIGLKLVGSALPRTVIAPTLGMTEAALPEFPKVSSDPLIVARVNARD